ncbi:acyltransferase [Acinetobacter baumannii]|jgi:peptidoglycan/LPS O-acetylase OafA/YrhL|nr:acyltransferase [Acinetobacter baumannii]
MSKINSAESIRGLACLAVVLSHLSLTFYPYLHRDNQSGLPNYDFLYYLHHSPFAFIYAGHAAVYVFFVLSGFVLAYATLYKRENAEKKILSMTIKRYPRLAIPAIISVLIYWTVFHFELNTSNASIWSAKIGSNIGSILDAFFDGSIRAFVFGRSNYNWVLWTMQTEFIGSLVVFIFSYFFIKNRNLALLWLPLSVLLSALLISISFSFGIACFVIGVLFYLYGRKISFISGLFMLLFGLYLAGIHNSSYSYQWIHNILGDKAYNLISIISAPLIVYSILMNDKISQLLDKKSLVYLGKLSFSIYLLHFLVIYLIALPLYNFLLPNFDFLISSIIACVSTILITLLISVPFSNNVDDLSIKVGKKIENSIMR